MIESAKNMYISTLLTYKFFLSKRILEIINQLLKGANGVAQYVPFVDPFSKIEILKGQEADYLNDYFNDISMRLGFDLQENVVFNIFDDPPTVDEIIM